MSENPVVERLARLAELFGAVCAEPDNPEVTARADRALWELDEFLATAR